jgi:prepilin-type N-terminal cleavage/methylation domain-containing protein
MNYLKSKQNGFTIVELLIVIVVIGILASITVVSFNGVQQRAGAAVLQSDLRTGSTQLELIFADEAAYPADTTDVRKSSGTDFEYTNNGNTFCLTASSQTAQASYYLDSAIGAISTGTCTGHNGYVAP